MLIWHQVFLMIYKLKIQNTEVYGEKVGFIKKEVINEYEQNMLDKTVLKLSLKQNIESLIPSPLSPDFMRLLPQHSSFILYWGIEPPVDLRAPPILLMPDKAIPDRRDETRKWDVM